MVTPLSVYLQNVGDLIQIMQSIHLVTLAILVSSACMIDLRLLGMISKDQPLATVARRFLPATWICLFVLLATGAVLIIAEPARALTAFPFQLKVVLILVATAVTLAQQRFVATVTNRRDTALALPLRARIGAVTSIVLWFAIIVCGRWIAYA